MKEPILVILAAGMGSRYGGLKQIDVVGDNGESIIDFSIYDAIEAGFKRLVLIIRREHEEAFQKALGNKISPFIEVEYAYQDMRDIPRQFKVPQDRVKPWGTTHALLSCRNILDAPFMVINADDYYGKEAYKTMYRYLTEEITDKEYCMIAYILNNTLTDYGSVTRGDCQVENGYLKDIVERHKIKRIDGVPCYSEDDANWYPLDPDKLVSMNFWGFTPKIMDYLKPIFERFLEENLEENPLKCEHVIPTAIGEMIQNGDVNVKVLTSSDQWYGITYREDKAHLVDALAKLKAQNLYPHNLWDRD
ncbi:MAG: nucleotidyltransferase [Erysipelotrichaceae bacterium]|nr:nucleotidyltransferase [Erysipelotrichaceae bacterium]